MIDIKKIIASAQDIFSTEYTIFNVLKDLKLLQCARKANIRKKQGDDAYGILIIQLLMVFMGKTVNHFVNYGRKEISSSGKDVYYRFSQMQCINWRRFLQELSMQVISRLSRYTSWKNRFLVLDDTVLERTGNHIEHLSWVFDHSQGKSVKGHKALVLGWGDRSSFIPLDVSIQGSKKKLAGETRSIKDKRTVAYRRRKELSMTKFESAFDMLKRSLSNGIDVSSVMFDSWFCKPFFIKQVTEDIGYNVICMLTQTSKLTVNISGKTYSTKRLSSEVFKFIKGNIITVGKTELIIKKINAVYGGVPVTIVLSEPIVAKKGFKPVLILATDTALEASEIIENYSQRWQIETLFRETKQKYHLGKSHVRIFESTVCFVTLSLARSAILAYMERESEDHRITGSVFEHVKYEVEEIKMFTCFEKFLKLMIKVADNADLMSIGATLNPVIEQITDGIRTAIQNLLFQRCET